MIHDIKTKEYSKNTINNINSLFYSYMKMIPKLWIDNTIRTYPTYYTNPNVIQSISVVIKKQIIRKKNITLHCTCANEEEENNIIFNVYNKRNFTTNTSIYIHCLAYKKHAQWIFDKITTPPSYYFTCSRNKYVPIYYSSLYLYKNKSIYRDIMRFYYDYLNKKKILSDNILMPFCQVGLKEAFYTVHNPQNKENIDNIKYIQRIIYEQFFCYEYNTLLFFKKNIKRRLPKITDIRCINDILTLNTWLITKEQRNIILNVINGLQGKYQINRLIQGDVGSGKTFIAICIAYYVLCCDYQVALMAPTIILSQQHFKTFQNYFKKHDDIKVIHIHSNISEKEKRDRMNIIKSHKKVVIVGTHAILSKKISMPNLGLLIIDEEHKFGVEQRSQIPQNSQVDVIRLSATPIPRSLVINKYSKNTLYVKREKQKNNVHTIKWHIKEISQLIDKLIIKIKQNSYCFWICPRIYKTLSTKASYGYIEERAQYLTQYIDKKYIEIIHGDMQKNTQEMVFAKFSQKLIKILLATSIVETGIHIEHANIIIIENPSYFSISQLHQLRGRIGRNGQIGYCILLYDDNISAIGKNKIDILTKYNDGEKLSEMDLYERGQGITWSTYQSGGNFHKISAHIDNHTRIQIQEKIKKFLYKTK